MNRLLRPAILAVVLLALAAAGWWAWRAYRPAGGRAIEATGTIEGTSVDLCAKAAGTITRLPLKEGDRVTQGQVVAEIARNDLVAQRERDAIAVLKAEAQLRDLTSGAREQEIEQARAGLDIARASAGKSSADYSLRQQLFQQGAASRDELERFRLAAELDKSRLDAAAAALSLLEQGSRPEVIEAARQEVDRSRAVLKASDAVLDDLKIVSPIDGTVNTRNYERGEFVPQGAAVATVVDLDDLWVKVYIPTGSLPAVRLGQQVHFTVSGTPQDFTGTVSEIASRGEFTPKTIQTKEERTNVVFGVKIRISGAGGVLKPGMPADVTF